MLPTVAQPLYALVVEDDAYLSASSLNGLADGDSSRGRGEEGLSPRQGRFYRLEVRGAHSNLPPVLRLAVSRSASLARSPPCTSSRMSSFVEAARAKQRGRRDES